MMKGLLKFVMAAAVMAVCTVSVKAQDSEYTILGANLPQIDGVKAQIIGGENATMELLQTGWWFVQMEATANDYFSFAGQDNATGKDYVLAQYDSESSAWIEFSLKFSDVWSDDSYKGTPCKWIELELNDAEVYAWKSINDVIPAKVSSVAADEPKKAIKVFEDGVMYIIKDGVKYDMLGVAQ
ncbi:MAG: hypothetical protein J5763_03640 [Bacteroidaceae bacterium]|nr:hypothetical protein [Bacteroidaceae bacterium]